MLFIEDPRWGATFLERARAKHIFLFFVGLYLVIYRTEIRRPPSSKAPVTFTKHDRPTNPERNLEMRGMATFSRHLIGRRAIAMLEVSIVRYRARGRVVLRCAVPRAQASPIFRVPKTGLPIGGLLMRCAVPHSDVPGDAPRDASGDAPRDMPGGRAAERPKGRATGRARGRTAGLARGTRHGTCQWTCQGTRQGTRHGTCEGDAPRDASRNVPRDASADVPGSAVLCCAVLCCAVLCCAVLCCAVLCCAVLCRVRASRATIPLNYSASEPPGLPAPPGASWAMLGRPGP